MGRHLAIAETFFSECTRHLSACYDRKAEECFLDAIGLEPEFAEVHANLGMMHDQKVMTEDTEHHYRYSIDINPNIADTL